MKKGWITVKATILASVVLTVLLFTGVAAAVCVQPPSGMVSWWGGDNNALDMVGGNNGTLVNDATFAPGMVGQAFSFDGVDDYVNVGDLDLSSTFTIDAWIKPITTNVQLIMTKGHISPDNRSYWFSVENTGTLSLYVRNGSGQVTYYSTVSSVVTAGQWNHVAVVYDGNAGAGQKIKFYVNGLDVSSGVSVAGDAGGTPENNFANSIIGSNEDLFFPYAGLIDEVEIFNRALSADEIAAIYNAGSAGKCRSCTAPPSGMISWWAGDDNAQDMQGVNHGTLMNNASFSDGKVGRAFSFDGVADYVTVPDSASLDVSGTISIDAWIYRNDATAEAGLLEKGAPGTNGVYELAIYDHKFYFRLNGAGLNMPSVTSLPVGTWTHVAGTYDGTTAKIYINGILDATQAYSASIGTDNNPLYIGLYGTATKYFPGLIDELEIFNRALTASEIAAIYNAGSAGKCKSCTQPPPNMVSWWKGEGSADDVFGLNNGTLQGGATFAPGKVGQAFSFDGEDGHILVPHSASVNITGAITMDAWFKLDELADSGIIIKGDANGTINLSSYSLGVRSDGKVYIGLYYGDTYDPYISTDSLVSADQWYHVAATWDGTTTNSDNVKLYLDGTLVQKWNKTTSLNSTAEPVTIGSMQGPTYYHSLKGLIDEVEIFNRALSAAEISAIYNAGRWGKCSYVIGTNSPSNGTIVCNALVASGYDSVCTITSNTGYYLSALSDNTTNVLSSVAGTPPNLTYTITGVTEAHTLEATFSEYMIKRVSSLDYYYNLLTEVFEAVDDNDTVMLRQGSFTGSAYDRDGVSITLKGGYNTGFGSNTDQHSTISDLLTISRGTVTVENVTIQ